MVRSGIGGTARAGTSSAEGVTSWYSNTLTEAIDVPDAASRHVRPGTKVVVELTSFPEPGRLAQGVITEVLGREGERDVDLKSVIVQHNLPQAFPEDVLAQARAAIESVDWDAERAGRADLTQEAIVTIDPNDAKDYDDAISLKRLDDGHWELGVHIADVARFVPVGTPLDREATARGNSAYFPGFVIPMLPEILSNGICSLQEGVPRLCKSVWITLDSEAHVVTTRFGNTVIRSAKRLRYREAQALIDQQSARSALSASRRAQIADAAGGNPLFLEQLLAHQTEPGDPGQPLILPPTIEALLDARIDQLPREERDLMERAAVEGLVFHRGAVTALLPADEQADDQSGEEDGEGHGVGVRAEPRDLRSRTVDRIVGVRPGAPLEGQALRIAAGRDCPGERRHRCLRHQW